jgi:murein DD-endopeptidase MepM/ murein hydrolase activator NlpD
MKSSLLKLYQRRLLPMNELIRAASQPIWDNKISANLYIFPLPNNKDWLAIGREIGRDISADQINQIGNFLTAASPQSYIGPYQHAIDFLVSDGTEILAAADGKIVEFCERHSEWGDDQKFRDKLNFITLAHVNGEFSQYCHLAWWSVSDLGLQNGDKVLAGQPIGVVGKTGWTDRDHLHFLVFRVDKLPGNPFDFYSVQVRFKQI